MKTFFVINPQSANGVTGRKWPELRGAAEARLGPVGHGFTQGPMDAARLSAQALKEGYECVVAVGGDGTLNEVVNGFFEQGRPINPKAAVAVLPRGTGGDFRRTFQWNEDVGAALQRIAAERAQPFDVGLVEYTTASGERQTRYFANICSFGVSGLVDQEVNRSSKALGGKLSFMLGSVKALLKYSDKKVRFAVDDGPSEEVWVTTLAVANGRYFGGGMCVAPEADTGDGLLDVTLWSGYGLADFALKSRSIYDGSHVRWKGTRQLRCKTLTATSDSEVLLDVDGEQPGRLPCKISILPAAIQLKA